jgi:hypothetical protein
VVLQDAPIDKVSNCLTGIVVRRSHHINEPKQPQSPSRVERSVYDMKTAIHQPRTGITVPNQTNSNSSYTIESAEPDLPGLVPDPSTLGSDRERCLVAHYDA